MADKMMRYVDIHAHSTFSYGDGYAPVEEHVERLAKLGRSHVCLSEHGNVSSWAQLEKSAEKHDVTPLFAIEIYIAPPGERRKNHMILLAMSEIGLQNINRIVTQSWKQFYQFPTVYWKDLVRWNEGIIALSGCADSQLSCILLGGKSFGEKRLEPRDGDLERAIRGVRKFQEVFGDRYFLEVQRFPRLDRTCALNPLLAQISRETGVSLAATSDSHYPYPDQNAMQRILHASHRGGTVESADASWEYDILLTYPESDLEIYRDLRQTGLSKEEAKSAIENTQIIANRCDVRLPKAKLPKFIVDGKVPEKSAEVLLQEAITLGYNYRLQFNKYMQEHKSEYKKRIKHEYEVICATEGFADYFLMVADIITWAKSQGIAVGPGRGSSAGSLVCYLLAITEIDSMQFPMLFERFLDPTRTDPPDIDIDFEDDRRDEVFEYAAQKYGAECVANIGTFTRYRGKNSLDDIARVYRIPMWKIDAVKAKLIERAEGHPRFFNTLEDTFNSFEDIRELVNETPELNYAAKLEGNIRGFGVHAAGMVISSVPLDNVSATYQREIGGRLGSAIAFDKKDAAYLGLLKIDALSLQTMGMISKVCELTRQGK
ncbi:DNA polymerase [Mycobacterium phage Fowlmouth]|uniref:DnaE-like DNA polymerase III n=2 Tax=Fowlmouthvirus fowlmouth TaxID=2845652 RepID=A0A7G8LPX4_9CAUD|nr:DNA polymerase [Mycobacterium phage Fowlmouth]AYN58034.1 DnaE-like DNA polymerase III alpha [Mycobacterium phage Fowlmouth]QNJ59296.1 DnaE-like DNA polymerase III [Mycobacterium phage MrMiyagi]